MESISSRLQGLFNELELIDDPRRDPLRVILQSCISDVLAFESNFGFSNLVKENEALKEKVGALEADESAQIEVLRDELKVLSKENTARKEEENYPTLTPEQFWILEILPLESQGGFSVQKIAEVADIPEGEVEIHLDFLKSKLANHTDDSPTRRVWFCSVPGTKYLLAMKAGEEHLKYDRLPQLDDKSDDILRRLDRAKNAWPTSLIIGCGPDSLNYERLARRLQVLERSKLVKSDDGGISWRIDQMGRTYVSQHRGARRIFEVAGMELDAMRILANGRITSIEACAASFGVKVDQVHSILFRLENLGFVQRIGPCRLTEAGEEYLRKHP